MTLIFSIHYFLWYGALTTIFSYEMVYARQYTNSTTIQFGYLNMVLPFVTVLTTPIICSMADRNRCHRSYFTISLILTQISLCLYAILPLIMKTPRFTSKESQKGNDSSSSSLQTGPWIYFCVISLICDLSMGVNTCLSDSFAVLQAEEMGTNFGRIIVWGTFGWASTAFALCFINQWSLLPRLVPGILFGATLLTLDVVIVSFWKKNSDFKLDLIPTSAAQTLTGSASSSHKDASDYMPLNELAKINLGPDERQGIRYRRTKSPVELLQDLSVERPSETVTVIIKKPRPDLENAGNNDDTASTVKTINSSEGGDDDGDDQQFSKTVSSGYSRLDKRVAKKGAQTSFSGFSSGSRADPMLGGKQTGNQNGLRKRKKKKEKEKEKEKEKNFASFKMQLILLGMILRKRKSLIRYLILFILSGFFMSMHWNYFFLYLEKIYYSQFELISAISMISQSILGELPFFVLSRKFIDLFGKSHTLSISIISIGIRFLLYRFLLPKVSMYFILIPDCFQGPNYGLFYVIMTEVGLEYSFCDDELIEDLAKKGKLDRTNRIQVETIRLSLRSTVQSVAFACYEGLGVGLGSLIGGWLVHSYGFETLWLSMAIGSISVGLLNVLLELTIWKEAEEESSEELFNSDPPSRGQKELSERQEFIEAKRRGTLKKLARPRPFPAGPPSGLAQSQSHKLASDRQRTLQMLLSKQALASSAK